MLKIVPDCLNGKTVAYINKGFFTPCCQVDGRWQLEDFIKLGFLDEKFHISNLKTPEDISSVFESDEWQDFYETLFFEPNEAPAVCKRTCGYIDGEKIMFDKKSNIEIVNV